MSSKKQKRLRVWGRRLLSIIICGFIFLVIYFGINHILGENFAAIGALIGLCLILVGYKSYKSESWAIFRDDIVDRDKLIYFLNKELKILDKLDYFIEKRPEGDMTRWEYTSMRADLAKVIKKYEENSEGDYRGSSY